MRTAKAVPTYRFSGGKKNRGGREEHVPLKRYILTALAVPLLSIYILLKNLILGGGDFGELIGGEFLRVLRAFALLFLGDSRLCLSIFIMLILAMLG